MPTSTGKLVAGDVLVSNFNDGANNQGTSVTIMPISPTGKASTFSNVGAQVKGTVGLTTALSVFRNGDVVVGACPHQREFQHGHGRCSFRDQQRW